MCLRNQIIRVKYLQIKLLFNCFFFQAFSTHMAFFLGSVYEEIWVGGDLIVRSDLHIGSVNGILLCDRLSRALLLDRPGFIPAATISAVSGKHKDTP